ncbi:CMRF35-like molecule 1 [Sinocyclocheilus anshuiensis]|uniref:CMRF35-like molecule 1 n=1 Tax=Sinocyclocheilus anshuiensis TaxID=1608454 RepID=UPI0007BA401B|nr:PREDICTED: CMRF35-like molecule 1 [Sinocyclocheilus anshuiensis]
MKLTLMMSGFLLMVSSSQCVDITERGTEGEQVTIKCPYAKGYENSYKYLYKGQYKDKNLILKSDGGESSMSEGRFSLRDDHQTRSFTVTIRDLRMADAGLYCCGAGWGEYKLIQLNVIKAPQKTRPVQISTSTLLPYTNISTDHTSTVTPQTERERTRTMTGSTAVHLNQPKPNLSSVAGGLGSVLLVLVLCSGMFLVLKKRKRKSGTALFQQSMQHNTETERMYEIPNSDVITSASSSNQTPASDLKTRPQGSAVYATVTNQQPDSNPSRIHSTNQVTDTDCDYYASMKPPETTPDNRTELIYSTATHPQNVKTNDGPIYSMIKHK